MKEAGEMKFGKGKLVVTAVVLALALMAQSFRAAGQAGRRAAPASAPESPRKPEDPPAFAPDPNRDEYQLVFTKSCRMEEKERKKERDTDSEWEASQAGFIDELNRIGAQGYRLVSISLAPRVAVLRRDDREYQYAIFQTESHTRFSDDEFEHLYAPLARKGFGVADYFYLHGSCDNGEDFYEEDKFRPPMPLKCEHESVFVLEQQKDSETPRHYELIHAPRTLRSKEFESGLAEELKYAQRLNRYPTHMLTKFEVLAQSATNVDNSAEYEVQIVGRDLNRRINGYAHQGYRLMARPLEAAIMYRRKGETSSASYLWISEKNLEQELPKLQGQGAIYRMNQGCYGWWVGRTQMIFEQPSVSDGNQHEYEILTIELKEIEKLAQQRVEIELTPASKEAVQRFNRLAKEGFEVRDLFSCDMSNYEKKGLSRVKILLERTKQ